MFAVIKSGGRQYKVSVDQTLEVNRLPVEDGSPVAFEEVLLVSDADSTMVGTPLVDSALVLATATKHTRGKKVIVFKYKSKKRYRHRRGHRQELTMLTVDDIVVAGKSLVTGKAPALTAQDVSLAKAAVSSTAIPESEISGNMAAGAAVEEKTTRRRRIAKVENTESTAEE